MRLVYEFTLDRLFSPIFLNRMYGCTDGNLEKDAKMKSHSSSDVSLFYLLGGY